MARPDLPEFVQDQEAALLEAATKIFGEGTIVQINLFYEGDYQFIVNPPEGEFPLRNYPGFSRRPTKSRLSRPARH